MAAIIGFILGALFGGWRAARRGGDGKDIAQYAAVYGIILGLLALAGSVAALRMGWF